MTPGRPEALIVGGPNGAGKTTFVRDYLEAYDLAYISADAIAKELDPERPERMAVQAGRAFSRRLREATEAGKSFIVESTLSGLGFRRSLARLNDAGYHTEIAFLFLNTPAHCRERVAERVGKGGHHVADEDVVRRFYRSKANFWRVYRLLGDAWFLIHNSGDGFVEVATGRLDDYVVSDELLMEFFLRDLGGER